MSDGGMGDGKSEATDESETQGRRSGAARDEEILL